MRLFASIGIFLLVVVLQSHCQQDQDLTVGSTQQNLDLVSRSVTNLAQKISLAIASPKSKTELFSPVSIAGALSLLLLGSGGTTRDELMDLLGFKGQPISFTDIHKSFGRLFQELVSNDPTIRTRIPWRENDKCNNPDYDYEDEPAYQPSKAPSNQGSRGKRDADSHYISVANGVFLDNDLQLNPNYENLTKVLYAGEISRKPLLTDPGRSANEINRWVQQATRNKILEIVSPEQVNNGPMVLASALYFKAKWETMFIKPDTRPRPYYINGRESPPIDIDIMATSGCFPFYEDKQLDVKIVGLPYQEGKSTMYIIMPNQSDRQKIRILQSSLNLGQVNEFIDRMVVKTGTVLLPKMKLENTVGLKDVLVSGGVQNIFNPYLSNLTKITKNHPIIRNGNRRDQLSPSSTPMPITQKVSSPKPNTQSTNTQNNINQRRPPMSVPGNPTSSKPPTPIQPIYTSTVPSTSQPYKVDINYRDCNLTDRCRYDGHDSIYYPDLPIIKDKRGCHTKPLTMQPNCPPGSQVYKDFSLCVADSHYKYQIGQGQCTQYCHQLRDWCYCCHFSVVDVEVPQPTLQAPLSPSSVDPQRNLDPPIKFEVGNRISQNAVVTSPPPTQQCRTTTTCDRYKCYTHTLCALVNYGGTPGFADNYGRRTKRQTLNNSPPPNLYVGDVLHKISLDINEQGTEGGAVTAVVIDRIASSFNLRVDGPFVIYLRNDVTKLPLFYGAVFDPRSNTSPFDRYSHEIQVANGLFLENSYNISPDYVRDAKEWYKSDVERLDFSHQPNEATKRVNSWVNQNTHGKIPEIFTTALGSNTVMVIASALYFKALWQDMFIEGATKPRDFYPNGRNESAIKVDMMAHGGCFPYYDSPELNAKILGIPYRNNQSTMYVIKPHNSNRQVLQELIAQLRPEELNQMIDKMRQTTAIVLFPKMHVSSTLNLKKTLKILGVRSIFSAPKSDLSGILGKSKSPEIQSPAPALPSQANRPTVNLIEYNKLKPKPSDFTNKLVFSRTDVNESSSSNDETTLPATTIIPTTLEETVDTDPTEASTPATHSSTATPLVDSPRRKRDVSYKAPSEVKGKPDPLNSKDFFVNKRIVKTTPGKKSHRTRREAQSLYVSDAIHKIDLEINETGTEGGAATAITLNRSGTNAVMRADEPFLIVIRNDRTKMPLFFGAIYDPSN